MLTLFCKNAHQYYSRKIEALQSNSCIWSFYVKSRNIVNAFQSCRDCFYLSSPLPATMIIAEHSDQLKFAYSYKETQLAVTLEEINWCQHIYAMRNSETKEATGNGFQKTLIDENWWDQIFTPESTFLFLSFGGGNYLVFTLSQENT